MDIQEEKADFEAEFRKTDFYKMNLVNCFCFINDRYVWDEVQAAWEMWQASKAQAVPEGFVVFPKKQTSKMRSLARDFDARLSLTKYEQLHNIWVKQAMIEAQEQKG